jgi:hypothetical protein
MAAPGIVTTLECIVFGADFSWNGQAVVWWRGMFSIASTTMDLIGVVKWGLGGGCEIMDARRAEALSGVVATSMADLARAMWTYTLKMAQWVDDSDA